MHPDHPPLVTRGTVLLVLAAVVLVLLPLLGGLLLLARDLRTPLRTAERATPVPLEMLRTGDCADDVFDGDLVNVVVDVVPCDGSHEHELYDAFDLPGDATFPGDDAVAEQADEGCYARFTRATGQAYEASELDFTSIVPSEDGWELLNDHRVLCLLYDPASEGLDEGGSG